MPGTVLMPATAGEMDALSVQHAIPWTSHGFVSILHHGRSFFFYNNTSEYVMLATARDRVTMNVITCYSLNKP